MRTSTPPWLLGTLGALSITLSSSALAGDPSTWTCETCPFEKPGVQGAVELGAGVVSDRSARFGDFTGLDSKGGFAIAGGDLTYRGADGLFARANAADLGLDIRSLGAEIGRPGLFTLRLGYAELPHRLSDSGRSPFLGIGGDTLTLPAGFPAASTGAMPLDDTLQPVELGFKRSRLDIGASVNAGDHWSYRLSARHDVRDGTQRMGGSFFSNASQLVAPIDQVTDQFEASAAYNTRRWQASLSYRASLFRNHDDALTWQNPFTAPVAGGDSGQLALAPDNEFHQLVATGGYQISPTLRASGELAVGRMTQDSRYLASTLNTSLLVPALPAASLDGRADTLDASLRLSAAPTDRLRLRAELTRNERDNQTASLAYPAVSTDLFVAVAPRANQPYSFTRDRLRLSGDYRGPGSVKLAAGVEQDNVQRTLQETDDTREATVWVRGSARPRENLSLSLKLSHAERDSSAYQVVATIQPPENPLLRKYNLADRARDASALRADLTLSETLSLGLVADFRQDDYERSSVGLVRARSASIGADLSYALSDDTRLRGFAQGERIRSRQVGSQQFGLPDWTARSEDAFDVVGLGLTHRMLKGKLELGADLALSRSRSDVTLDTGTGAPALPRASTSLDSLKLSATYRLRDNMSLVGSYWYESLGSRDWHLDDVAPATVPNLLALGELAPRYHVNVIRVALRYRF